jgi:hypothetical protein
MLRIILAAMLAFAAMPAARAGLPLSHADAPCAAAIVAAEDAFRLPPHLLEAVAEVESGRPQPETGRLQPWPWTINAEGAGAFFATKAAAVAAVRALQARGVRSIDVGCLQVNLMFHPHAFASLDEAFEPRANALYAAHFLTVLRGTDGDWRRAIGAYHSQTAALGDDYRRRVLALWHDPAAPGWQLGLAVSYRDFAPRSAAYADFAPSSAVYGAFATAGSGRGAALRR